MKSPTAIRVLLCGPAETVQGGLPAVVAGLLAGMAQVEDIQVVYLVYAKFDPHSGRAWRLFRELVQLAWFVATLLRLRIQVVHFVSAFDRKTLVRDSVYVWLAHRLRRRVLLNAQGGVFHLISYWAGIWRSWARRFLTSCEAVVVNSREERQDLTRLYGVRPSFVVLPNPVVLTGHSLVVERRGSTDREIRIVSAGRLVPAKGVVEAIQAMRHVRHPRARLYVFGNGPLMVEIRRLVSEDCLAQRVHIMGHVPMHELLTFYRRSDIFAFPSYHHEGFPMALFYAASCGMAVVTTKVRPVPDYMSEPENCLWVDPKDAISLADKIDRLAFDDELRRRQAAENMALASQFDPTRVAQAYLGVYRAILTPTGA